MYHESHHDAQRHIYEKFTNIHTQMHQYTYTLYIHMNMHQHIYTNTYLHTHIIHIYICQHIDECVDINTYRYKYKCIYAYTHVYFYIYTPPACAYSWRESPYREQQHLPLPRRAVHYIFKISVVSHASMIFFRCVCMNTFTYIYTYINTYISMYL